VNIKEKRNAPLGNKIKHQTIVVMVVNLVCADFHMCSPDFQTIGRFENYREQTSGQSGFNTT